MGRDLHPGWKGGVIVDTDGDLLTLQPRPGVVSAYFAVHRKVASEAIGRLLERHENVLRLNGNKRDNSPDNLFICGSIREAQERIHGRLPWPKKRALRNNLWNSWFML